MEAENKEVQYLPFSFEGSGKEFFRIWIVNIALTILTLGIYSAWAKVRTNRYFYANTYLNGSNFEYNAEPKRILIGRLIVFGIYAIFIIFFEYLVMMEVAGVIALIAFLVMPWLIRQAVSFKLRNTSYRNVPFRYTGTTWKFYKFFIFNALLFIILAGIASFVPFVNMIVIFLLVGYIYVKFKELLINNSHYGDGDFHFSGEVGDVYSIYFKITGWMILIGIAIGVVVAILIPAIFGGSGAEEIITLSQVGTESEGEAEISMMDMLIPMLGIFAIYLPLIFFQKGLSDGYHSNFVRDNTTLDRANLKGIMSPVKLGWISLTNILAIIFSLGLLYPWTKVRYIKYKLEHTYFRCVDYEQFESHGYVQGSTIGEETVDFFDIDIGL
ncbi:DUF898 domain-containing protein [Sulfurovum sp. bin170]|uniref:YjgN family protein n=1 Tax=Sulfurovum sp. bin170 TaxID=2695268 RepID=UPI0013DF031D|nr:YjgN family protein [Sulfurovum sp. bin170]NEW60273.1 DUF898 domain-containing protein [Sulfurovum sp. bin170]